MILKSDASFDDEDDEVETVQFLLPFLEGMRKKPKS